MKRILITEELFDRYIDAVDPINGSIMDREECEKEIKRSEFKLPDAIATLQEALKADAGYRHSWQANIAMAFKDEYRRHNEREDWSMANVEYAMIHEIANKAADEFLKNLERSN